MIVRGLYDTIQLQDKGVAEKMRRAADRNIDFTELVEERIAEDNPDYKKRPVEDRKLMDVCMQMESLFVARMLKAMRDTVHKQDLFHGGFPEEVFEDMLYDEYALQLSRKAKLGLAKMLYDEMSRK